MTSGQKFCTECGAPLAPGIRFCGKCGYRVADPNPANPAVAPLQPPVPTVPAVHGGPERIIGIVPFLEQGLLSVIHYTLMVTPQRLILCTWNPETDETMSGTDEEMMQESCTIAETKDEITHFRAKDWTTGPWQRYLSMPIDAITAGAPGSITIPIPGIAKADIICETWASTHDTFSINEGSRMHTFDLMYSQGPFLYRLLEPLLAEKISITDHLHKRHGLDRLLTGQEYK